MILLYIRFRVLQEHHDEFLNVVARLEKRLLQIESIISSELSQCKDEFENFIQVINLKSTVEDTQSISNTVLELLGKFSEDIIEMRYYRPLTNDS